MIHVTKTRIIIHKTTKAKFSTKHPLQTDKNKLGIWNELKNERDKLESDLDLIKDSVRAASKLSNGEKPSDDENETLEELQNNYPSFFDSEDEEEGSYSLLTKVMNVKSYLRNEVNSNRARVHKFIKSNPELFTQRSESQNQNEPESKGKEKAVIETGESSKGKEKQSVIDYINDLPHNPFDDLGND